MSERCQTVPVGDRRIGSGRQEHLHRRNVVRTAVAQHHGFHEGRPSEIVDVVERRSAFGEQPDHFVMTEVGGRDQRRAIVGAGDEIGAVAELQGQRDQGRVVGHCRDRQHVVGLALERVQVRARRRERAQGIVVRRKRRDMRRRAPGPVAGFEIGAGAASAAICSASPVCAAACNPE